MKLAKPFLEDCECCFADCTEKAVTVIFNRKVCRKHYLIIKLEAREKKEKKKRENENS